MKPAPHFTMSASTLRAIVFTMAGLSALVVTPGDRGLLLADTITVGSQNGAQIFFNDTLPRTYNFGVTQTGVENGLQLLGIDVNVKGGNDKANVSPVIVRVFGGLGGTGAVVATGTIAAATLTNQFNFITVPLASPLSLPTGGYSVVLTTANTANYFIKNGNTRLTTNGTAAVTASYWVEDTNTDGTAGPALNAVAPVLATYQVGTNAFQFGNYRVGTTLSATTTIVNTALVTSNTFTQALAVTGTTTGGVTSLSGLPNPFLPASGTATLVAGLDGLVTGPNNGTAGLTFRSVPGTSNTSGTTAIGSGTLTVSGTGYDWANATYSGTGFAFGFIHRGAATRSGTVAIGNQAVADPAYQDALDVSATTDNPLVSAAGFSGLAASAGGASRNNLVVTIDTASAGSLGSTLGLTLGSNANGVAGLSNGNATVVGVPGGITTTGTVYSGQSVWNVNGGGEWGTLAQNFGVNWRTFDGSPGLDPDFTDTDTATFSDALTSGTAAITVTAAAPNVRSLVFDNAVASYVISGVSGGSLALFNSGTAAATVTVASGSHSIAAPLTLGSDSAWSVGGAARLGVAGVIAGGRGVNKTGPGTLVFAADNTYAGPTTVSAGTLVINGDQSLAAGSFTVAAAATLAGSGTVGASTSVAGIHSPGNSPGIQTIENDLAYEAGATITWELIEDTLLNRGAAYDGIDVTGGLSFADPTSLSLVFNLAESVVDWNDPFWDSSYVGVDGWLVFSGATSLSGFGNLVIAGTDWADGIGEMLQTARPGASFGLHQEGGDVYLTYYAAVPEPPTLALAAAGMALIGLWCRNSGRKRISTPHPYNP